MHYPTTPDHYLVVFPNAMLSSIKARVFFFLVSHYKRLLEGNIPPSITASFFSAEGHMRLEQVTSGIHERPRTTSAANSKRKTANQISKFQMIT